MSPAVQPVAMSDWKFDVDEVGPDGVLEADESPPIEPGSPSAENVAFFVLGVVAAVYVLAKLAGVA